MKGRIFVSLVFIMAFLMTGCVEKTGYYTKAEDDVISLICDVTWASQKQSMMLTRRFKGCIRLEEMVRVLKLQL